MRSASLPAHWQVIAGVGARPSALDINRDWWPADMRSALGLLRDALEQIRAGHLRSTGG
jgi:hypothetical protein